MGVAAAGAATLSLEGCMTTQLHEPKYYTETFSAMYITQDQKQIVILGPRYHYIFQAPAELVRLVQSELHADLRASFDDFEVAADQTITGRYDLSLSLGKASLTPEKEALAQALGMAPRVRGEWTTKGTLKGQRYAAGDAHRGSEAMTPLNRSYSVSIREQPTAGEAMAKIALTPVTVAVDGALMIAAVVLLPFALVFLADRMGRIRC